MPRWFAVTVILLGLAFSWSVFWRAEPDRILKGTDDFLPLYAGARLVGTSELYNPQSVYREEKEASGVTGEAWLCTRMPWVPLFLWPFGQLPYSVAHWVWFGVRMAAVIAFIWIWPHNPKWITAAAISWFLPVTAALVTGQDAIWILFWIAVWQRLEPKHPFVSGLAIALCTAKFHLFLLLPLYLAVNRKWHVIWGASAGVTALLALSFIANGWTWPMEYLRVLLNPSVHPDQQHMYSFHGLLNMPFAGELAVSAIAAALAAWAIWKRGPTWGLVVTLAGGLLLSYHAYLMDCVVLLPGILLILRWFDTKRQKAVAAREPAAIAHG